MNKKIVLNDDSGNLVEVDLRYLSTTSITIIKMIVYTRKEPINLQLIKHLGKN